MRITLTAEERALLLKAISFARLGASFEGPGEYGRYSRPLDIGALSELEPLLEGEQEHPGARSFLLDEDLAMAAEAGLFFAAQQLTRYAEAPSTIHPIRAQLIAQRFGGEPVEQVGDRLTGLAARFASRHRKTRPTVPAPNDNTPLALGGRR